MLARSPSPTSSNGSGSSSDSCSNGTDRVLISPVEALVRRASNLVNPEGMTVPTAVEFRELRRCGWAPRLQPAQPQGRDGADGCGVPGAAGPDGADGCGVPGAADGWLVWVRDVWGEICLGRRLL
eukprot:350333-Chlamydomonas_euryale.AAC.2